MRLAAAGYRLAGVREGHVPADNRKAGTVLQNDGRQLTGRKRRAERSLVVVDRLRVLAELRQPNREGACDRRELAELPRQDETGDLRALGEQHLHRGDLGRLNRADLRERVEYRARAGQAEQDSIDDAKRERSVGG